jgi:hypothetical protein
MSRQADNISWRLRAPPGISKAMSTASAKAEA